jgi:alanine racemase
MTHFANAENNQAELNADKQYQQFCNAIKGLDGENSVANSASVLLHKAITADWIRPGVMLYGASPTGVDAIAMGLLPAMTLQSQLMAIQTLQAGEFVGYGSLFKADKTTRVGVVACGYADGYPRHAKPGTPVLVDGHRVPLIGRVSMDMLTVDITALPHVNVGSPVTLWGEGLPIDEVAAASDTIAYELMCAITPRVTQAVKN